MITRLKKEDMEIAHKILRVLDGLELERAKNILDFCGRKKVGLGIEDFTAIKTSIAALAISALALIITLGVQGPTLVRLLLQLG